MQDILQFILKNITTVPEDIKIDVQQEGDLPAGEAGTTNYLITVNPADVGRIIGKEGKIIKAIRTIMRVIAIQRGVHIRISVVSENGPQNDESGRVEVISPETPQPQDDGSITVEV